jgi:hypothetical protein
LDVSSTDAFKNNERKIRMGRISTRVADQTKGGFLDDVDGEIVSAKYARGSFVGDDGNTVNKTQAILGVQIEGREEPVPVFLSIGNADLICPYEDEDCTIEADEGQYLGAKGDKEYKGVSQDSGWGRFQAQLVAKLKFPDANFDAPLEDALVGLRGHWTSLPGGKYKGKVGKPVPVLASIEKDSIPTVGKSKKSAKPAAGGGLGKLKKKPAPAPVEEEVEEVEEVEEETPAPAPKKAKPAAVKAKPKAAPAEEEAADEDDLEASVGEAVISAVAKTPLPKGQLAQRVGKVFEGQDNRASAVQLSMSDKFLKAGVEAGLWAYDGRTISAAE